MDTIPPGHAPHQEYILVPPSDVAGQPPMPVEPILYASFFRRFFAYFLDNLLIAAFTCFVTAATLGDITTAFSDFDKLVFLAELVYGLHSAAFIGYFTIATGSSGQTAGKYLMSIKVSMDGGGETGYPRAFVRTLGYFVSGFFAYLGFLFAIFSKKSQAFHDLLSGTVVLAKD